MKCYLNYDLSVEALLKLAKVFDFRNRFRNESPHIDTFTSVSWKPGLQDHTMSAYDHSFTQVKTVLKMSRTS